LPAGWEAGGEGKRKKKKEREKKEEDRAEPVRPPALFRYHPLWCAVLKEGKRTTGDSFGRRERRRERGKGGKRKKKSRCGRQMFVLVLWPYEEALLDGPEAREKGKKGGKNAARVHPYVTLFLLGTIWRERRGGKKKKEHGESPP